MLRAQRMHARLMTTAHKMQTPTSPMSQDLGHMMLVINVANAWLRGNAWSTHFHIPIRQALTVSCQTLTCIDDMCMRTSAANVCTLSMLCLCMKGALCVPFSFQSTCDATTPTRNALSDP